MQGFAVNKALFEWTVGIHESRFRLMSYHLNQVHDASSVTEGSAEIVLLAFMVGNAVKVVIHKISRFESMKLQNLPNYILNHKVLFFLS